MTPDGAAPCEVEVLHPLIDAAEKMSNATNATRPLTGRLHASVHSKGLNPESHGRTAAKIL